MSPGVDDSLYSSNIARAINPKKSIILPWGRKLINGTCVEISLILPTNEKFALIKNGNSASVKCSSSQIILLISLFKLLISQAPGGIKIYIKQSL